MVNAADSLCQHVNARLLWVPEIHLLYLCFLLKSTNTYYIKENKKKKTFYHIWIFLDFFHSSCCQLKIWLSLYKHKNVFHYCLDLDLICSPIFCPLCDGLSSNPSLCFASFFFLKNVPFHNISVRPLGPKFFWDPNFTGPSEWLDVDKL